MVGNPTSLFTQDLAKATLFLALVFTSVSIGLFLYLGRLTRKANVKLWSVAWMFYAVYLATSIGLLESPNSTLLLGAQLTCVGTCALFLFWGTFHLTDSPRYQRELGLGLIMMAVWSAVAVCTLRDSIWGTLPIYLLLAAGNWYTGLLHVRSPRRNRGTLILSAGFICWGVFVVAFPVMRDLQMLLSLSYCVSAIFPFLIALGLIVDEEVRNSEQTYRIVFDSAREAIFMVDLDTIKILDANEAAQRLTHRKLDKLIDLNFQELCPELRKEGTAEIDNHKMFLAVFRPSSKFPIVRPNGSNILCEGDTRLVQWRGRPVLQINIREVDKERKVGQQIRRGEKLSALGQLIAGVAHELNNPLAVVMGYTQLLATQKDFVEKTRYDILKILHESERAAKVVRNLLSFVRPCDPQPVTVDINRLVSNCLDIRESEIRENKIELVKNLAPDLPKTKADTHQIEQVLTNVISNAIQALTGHEGERKLTVTTADNGFCVCVTVSNTGPGISQSVLGKIFDPFFTTKDPGKGTGLGLTISHNIIKQHRGKIWAESKLGRSTTFFIELPIVPCEIEVDATPGAPTQATPSAETSRRRLLLVDDEPGILGVLEEVLSGNGYAVETASNGAEALRRIEAGRYDLIISDLCMPEVDGQKLYRAIQDKNPDMLDRLVFLTGDTISSKSRTFLEETGSRWFTKPFSISDIEEFVRTFVERNPLPPENGNGNGDGEAAPPVEEGVRQFAS